MAGPTKCSLWRHVRGIDLTGDPAMKRSLPIATCLFTVAPPSIR